MYDKPAAASRRRRRTPAAGWVPNQHGAWAMMVTPWLLGLVWAMGAGEFRAVHVVLFGFWMVGYFAFFAATQWLRSRFQRRYLPALATYGGVAAVLGVAVAAMSPQWWSWVIVFVPVCAFAMWLSWKRQERDVSSGLVTIAAASLIAVLMGSDGLWRLGGMPVLGALALICFGYFGGTVFYVKTIIRERGKPGWVVASVVWHLLWTIAVAWVPQPLPAAWVVAFFAALTIRALLLPLLGPMAGRRIDVRAVGIWEFATTTLLLVILVPALLV